MGVVPGESGLHGKHKITHGFPPLLSPKGTTEIFRFTIMKYFYVDGFAKSCPFPWT
jgi:hypothetical protein